MGYVWTQSQDGNSITKNIAAIETVTVPAGVYTNSYKITATSSDTSVTTIWLAPNVGMVKRLHQANNSNDEPSGLMELLSITN